MIKASETSWSGIGTAGTGDMWLRTATSGTPDGQIILYISGNVSVGEATADLGWKHHVNGTSHALAFSTSSNRNVKANIADIKPEEGKNILDSIRDAKLKTWTPKPVVKYGGHEFDRLISEADIPFVTDTISKAEFIQNVNDQLGELENDSYYQKTIPGLIVGEGNAPGLEAMISRNPITGLEDGIDLGASIHVLLTAIQEIAKENEDLKSRIAALENR